MSAESQSHDVPERRAFVRLPKTVKVQYKVVKNSKNPSTSRNPSEKYANTKDISAGGLALCLKESIPLYSYVELRIHLPGPPEPIVCLGEIVRSQLVEGSLPYWDTAVCFLDISNHDRVVLDKFVQQR